MRVHLQGVCESAFSCPFCGRPCSEELPLDPLWGGICPPCQEKREQLLSWLRGRHCDGCGCVLPSSSSAQLYHRDTQQRCLFSSFYSGAVHPEECTVKCRMCAKPPPQTKPGGFLNRMNRLARALRGRCRICSLPYTQENQHLFEWDHLYPAFRERLCVSAVACKGNTASNRQQLRCELERCRLVCLNCHDAHTEWQRHNIFAVLRFWDWEYSAQLFLQRKQGLQAGDGSQREPLSPEKEKDSCTP
jgi:hypothetical protein